MIKWIYRLLNHDQIDKLNETIDTYRERNKQLEAEVREYKGYKLKFEVTKLYVEDDEALLELFEVAKNNEQHSASRQHHWLSDGRQSAFGGARATGGLGLAGLQNLTAAAAQQRGFY